MRSPGIGCLVGCLAAFLPTLAAGASLDRDDLEPFLDGLVRGLMETHHVPGVTFVVVKDDEVVLQRGWGFADLESRRPVDPGSTLFRVASVSKLFTTTAALQLVESGKLDLDRDVHEALPGFRLEGDFSEPVTLAHLLTHTGGFDDRYLQGSEPLEAQPWRLAPYLAERMPPRIREPGRLISYSNHGFALAGLMVQEASGQPFGEYIQEHVLAPLGMGRSRVGLGREPPADLATPYVYRRGRYEPIPLSRSRRPPSAAVITSAGDMARFMRAHLNGGVLDGRRILSEATARLMQSRQFTHAPRLDGWCYGFAEGRRNGWRTIGHDGSLPGFKTQLVLVPDAGVGFFLSTNSESGGRLLETARNAILDRYFPALDPAPESPGTPAPEVAGHYVPDRHSRGTFLKLALLWFEASVEATERGFVLSASWLAAPEEYVTVGPAIYRGRESQALASLGKSNEGRVEHLFLGSFALNRLAWYERPSLQGLAFGSCVVAFVATLVAFSVGSWRRRFRGAKESLIPLRARLVTSALCIVNVGFVIGFFGTLVGQDLWTLSVGVPESLLPWLVLPIGGLAIALALPWVFLRSRGAGRWLVSGVAAAAVLFFGLAANWNLIGFHY